MDDNKNKENDIEVVIGDNTDLTFSEVEDIIEELKPKVEKKSNIIIPKVKKQTTKKDDSLLIVDPAMADNGKLYPGFDGEFVEAMKQLCGNADYMIPNITEACFLTDLEYRTEYDEAYVNKLIDGLRRLGCKNIIFTGISYAKDKTGVLVCEGERCAYYEHVKLPNSCHGTGDIYASAFVGALMKGKTAYDAAKIAANYTVECIRSTAEEENHWYGAKFEPVLDKLIAAVNEE